MHRRRAIREAMLALITGLPTTGDSVTEGRVYPAGVVECPTIDITTVDDTLVDVMAGGPPYSQNRMLTVEIVIRAEGDDYLRQLDDIALEAEQAIMADPYLGGLVHDLKLQDVALEAESEVGETPVGALTLSWEATYSVGSIDPQ